MTGDIIERLEAWAHDTEQSWESIKPLEERGGCEYWRSDKRDIDMVREAADAIRRLKEEVRRISDERDRAQRIACGLGASAAGSPYGSPHDMARVHGWQCFGEAP